MQQKNLRNILRLEKLLIQFPLSQIHKIHGIVTDGHIKNAI